MGKGGLVMRNKRSNTYIGNLIRYTYLSVLAIIAIFPLFWVVISSVKGRGEMTSDPTALFPKTFTLEYYRHVLVDMGFGTNILNSLMISLSSTLISITVSTLAAYGIVRFFPKVGRILTRFLITTYMFPPILLAIPYSIMMAKIGLTNTRVGLVIVYLSFSVPYAVWLLVGFFKTVPLEIEEAAMVDGANKFTVFLKIVLPIVAPGVVATAIYTFINAWNEFLFSLILMNSSSKMTISVALKSLEGAEIMDWGDMMAASTLVVIPSVIFFMIIQNKIAGGIAQGSIK